jgi:hypothetical protein
MNPSNPMKPEPEIKSCPFCRSDAEQLHDRHTGERYDDFRCPKWTCAAHQWVKKEVWNTRANKSEEVNEELVIALENLIDESQYRDQSRIHEAIFQARAALEKAKQKGIL